MSATDLTRFVSRFRERSAPAALARQPIASTDRFPAATPPLTALDDLEPPKSPKWASGGPMTGMEKFSKLLEVELKAHGVEIDKEGGFFGAAAGLIGRGVAAPFRAGAGLVRRGAQAVAQGARGFGASFKAMQTPGMSVGMGAAAGRNLPAAGKAISQEGLALAQHSATKGTLNPVDVRSALSKSWSASGKARAGSSPVSSSMSGGNLPAMAKKAPAAAPAPAAPAPVAPAPARAGMSLQERMGQPAPAAGGGGAPGQPKDKPPGWGAPMLMASMMSSGKKPAQASAPAPAGFNAPQSGSSLFLPSSMKGGSMFEFLDKVSEAMPDATDDEKIAMAFDLAIEAGFTDALTGTAREMGYVPPAAHEKTAAEKTEKKADDPLKIRYTKFTVQDIIGHLSDQWGRPEPIEKDAAARPGFAKLSKLVEVERGRPS